MEWPIVAIVALVVLIGGSKLPSLARNLGRAPGELKKGLAEGNQEASELNAQIAEKARFDEAVAREVEKRAGSGQS